LTGHEKPGISTLALGEGENVPQRKEYLLETLTKLTPVGVQNSDEESTLEPGDKKGDGGA